MKKIYVFLGLIALTFNLKNVNASTLNCNNYLQYGSTGEQVKILQEKLNHTMQCNLDVDGIIGSRTKNCILQFQAKYNLAQDAIVGPKTCSKLNSIYRIENAKSYVVVTGSEVNIRSGANTTSTIKATVKQGEVLRVYGTKIVNGVTWYKVYTKYTRVDDNYGYICGNYAKKTAIILDLSEQQLTYYNKGKIVMSVPVITGKKNYHDTPIGKYTLNPTQKGLNRTLKGLNDDNTVYSAFVNYWMPFITERGIGFHDASWRNIDDYTKTTYIENGSHGCVNMRPNDAKKLYENINTTTDVIIID